MQRLASNVSDYDYNKNWIKKIWVHTGTEIARKFKNFCKAEKIQYYSTRSDTQLAFAERTLGSLKKTFYRYMEDYGWKYIHKKSQTATTLKSRSKLGDRSSRMRSWSDGG